MILTPCGRVGRKELGERNGKAKIANAGSWKKNSVWCSQDLLYDLLISPHNTDVGPPLGNANDKLAARAVQLFKIAKARPSIERGEKLRFNSLLWPRLARRAASASLSGWCGMLGVLNGSGLSREMREWKRGNKREKRRRWCHWNKGGRWYFP